MLESHVNAYTRACVCVLNNSEIVIVYLLKCCIQNNKLKSIVHVTMHVCMYIYIYIPFLCDDFLKHIYFLYQTNSCETHTHTQN